MDPRFEKAIERTDAPAPPPLRVVLIEPAYEGNVGAVARVCANFGVDDLVIVQGPTLTDRAGMMAVHARELLERADRVSTFGEAIEGTSIALGFSAETATRGQDHLRTALSLPDAAERVRAMDGRAALVFGREDDGLSTDELELLDLVVHIPVDPGYPSMNLSHAVSVALYEVSTRGRYRPFEAPAASRHELDLMLAHYEALARAGRMQDHKLQRTMVCLRRVVGRTRISTWEYHRMMGVLSKALKALDAWPVEVQEREDTGGADEDLATEARGAQGRTEG